MVKVCSPEKLIFELHKRNILVLSQIRNDYENSVKAWLSLEDLNMSIHLVDECRHFTSFLSEVGILLEYCEYVLVWEPNLLSNTVMAKLAYEVLVYQKGFLAPRWWYWCLWKMYMPLKVKML